MRFYCWIVWILSSDDIVVCEIYDGIGLLFCEEIHIDKFEYDTAFVIKMNLPLFYDRNACWTDVLLTKKEIKKFEHDGSETVELIYRYE